MTVTYGCNINLRDYIEEDITTEDIANVKAAIEEAGYDFYQDGDEVTIEGEVEVDDYSTDAADVASEIKWILWKTAEIDADVDAEAEESEPDWDHIYGF